jgi:hypothetical protein
MSKLKHWKTFLKILNKYRRVELTNVSSTPHRAAGAVDNLRKPVQNPWNFVRLLTKTNSRHARVNETKCQWVMVLFHYK